MLYLYFCAYKRGRFLGRGILEIRELKPEGLIVVGLRRIMPILQVVWEKGVDVMRGWVARHTPYHLGIFDNARFSEPSVDKPIF